jgi:hypothetical protein
MLVRPFLGKRMDGTEIIEEERFMPNVPMPLSLFQQLLQSCAAPADRDFDFIDTNEELVKVRGQGLGYPQVHAYWCACGKLHHILGIETQSPTRDAGMREWLGQMRAKHSIEHTSGLDVLEGVYGGCHMCVCVNGSVFVRACICFTRAVSFPLTPTKSFSLSPHADFPFICDAILSSPLILCT